MISDPPGTAAGGPPVASAGRPSQVTTAGVLLLSVPALSAIGLGLVVIALLAAQDNAARVADELAREGYFDPQGTVDDVLVGLWFQLALNVFIKFVQTVGFGILAFVVLRGSQAGRIIVYVLAGITIVGAFCVAGLDALRLGLYSSLEQTGRDAGMAFVTEADLLPGWFLPANYGLLAVNIVIVLAAVWLLTRPAANAYFNRDRRPPAPRPQPWQQPPPPPHQPWQQPPPPPR